MRHARGFLGCVAVIGGCAMSSGCAVQSVSPECETSWATSVDEGEICEESVAAGSEAGLVDAVVSPRDPASGLPTGKRQHKPFTFLYE